SSSARSIPNTRRSVSVNLAGGVFQRVVGSHSGSPRRQTTIHLFGCPGMFGCPAVLGRSGAHQISHSRPSSIRTEPHVGCPSPRRILIAPLLHWLRSWLPQKPWLSQYCAGLPDAAYRG